MNQEYRIPEWALTDEEIRSALPSRGWLRDYVDYMETVTDAPLAYHWIVGLTIMSRACSRLDVRVYADATDPKRCFDLPMPIWAVLLGTSGDRKSFAVTVGVDILKRALGRYALLPSEGSTEAWTDFLSEHPEALMHRDELSYLFAQSNKSYLVGLKEWLLTLHSGTSYERILRSKAADRNADGGDSKKWNRRAAAFAETGSEKSKRKSRRAEDEDTDEGDSRRGGSNVIEVNRPRISIIGAIPPDVFQSKQEKLDWASGFFARFLFVGAMRTRSNVSPSRCPDTETDLARRLGRIANRPQAYVAVPGKSTRKISDWFVNEIDHLRHDPNISSYVYSHFLRYQEAAYRILALLALADEPDPNEPLVVRSSDIPAVCYLLEALRDAMKPLFGLVVKEPQRAWENDLMNFLYATRKGSWTTLRHIEQAFPNRSIAAMSSFLRLQHENMNVQRKKIRTKRGAPRLAYRCIKGPEEAQELFVATKQTSRSSSN